VKIWFWLFPWFCYWILELFRRNSLVLFCFSLIFYGKYCFLSSETLAIWFDFNYYRQANINCLIEKCTSCRGYKNIFFSEIVKSYIILRENLNLLIRWSHGKCGSCWYDNWEVNVLSCTKPWQWAVMYYKVRNIDFDSFRDFATEFWNFFDATVWYYFVFHWYSIFWDMIFLIIN
jgi:hypothetical protein